jgi:alpha-L-arabinofuranosidase
VIIASGVTATNCTDPGLAAATTYYYVASAVNAGGESTNSTPASATTAPPPADATLNIQANQPGVAVSSNLFGIFFEEINYGGDGGLYAELVRNRSFASSANPDYWTLVTNGTATGTMSVDTARPLNMNNLNSLKLTMQSGSGRIGAANSGYWGIALQSGATYDLNFYARGTNGFSGPVVARLESANGSQLYAQASFSGLTTNWQHFAASLASSGSDTSARLVLCLTNAGTVWLDEVSLFPRATFHSRTNGLRLDLANKLADLHPAFLRYPGGNFIESWNVTNAVRWKKTIGDLAQRPGHNNDSWGYWSTDGYGLDEFFRQCEDMGMEPLYGINAGLMLGYDGSANNTVPLDQMGPWVQDALDLIEYANGDTNTTWGAVRVANGHSAPYNLKYLEIGNENGGSYYNDRYTLFYDAIKAKYPNVQLISPGNWDTPPTSRPRDISDEHYYSDPAFFINIATKYDSYSRSGPKVFVGEYAVTSGWGTNGNLSAALGEAAFMTGMERNSDVVVLASYAPLFGNVNGLQWAPDLIYYDNSRVFGTPSYYVQQMFANNGGDYVLPNSITLTTNASGGLYASTTYDQSSGQVIIKAVNPSASSMVTAFNLAGVNSISPNATVIQLTSGSPSDENSFAAPTYVSPVTNSITNAGTSFTLTLPANSLSVIRLAASGINNYTNLSLQVPSPITNGTCSDKLV